MEPTIPYSVARGRSFSSCKADGTWSWPLTSIWCVRSPWQNMYREIHKSLRDFRPLRYSSLDGHAEGEHVNRGRDTPSFCPTLQVLDMSTLGDAADVNPVISSCGRNWLQVLYWLRVLYRRGRKSRRDLRITLYIYIYIYLFIYLNV